MDSKCNFTFAGCTPLGSGAAGSPGSPVRDTTTSFKVNGFLQIQSCTMSGRWGGILGIYMTPRSLEAIICSMSSSSKDCGVLHGSRPMGVGNMQWGNENSLSLDTGSRILKLRPRSRLDFKSARWVSLQYAHRSSYHGVQSHVLQHCRSCILKRAG